MKFFPTPESAFKKEFVNILLVEDNPGDVMLLAEMLKQSSYPVHLEAVPDGEKAINYLRRHNPYYDSPKPDLILLDLNLPRKNGHEVAMDIKQSSRLSRIPILILTNSNLDEDKWKAYQTHVDAYLLKPREWAHYHLLLKYLEEHWMEKIELGSSSASS